MLEPSMPRFKGSWHEKLAILNWNWPKSHNTVTSHNYILCVVRIFVKQT
jgi:hypothetical protein